MVLYWVPRRGRLPFGAWSTKTSHLVERFALFILIALGETILRTGATTSQLHLDLPRFAAFMLAFLDTAALWWLYFDGFRRIARQRLELASNPVQLARDAYIYLHVVLVAGVILSAVGDKYVIAHPTAVLAGAEAAVIAAGPALYLLGQVLVRLRLTGWVYWERLAGAVACVLVGVIGTVVPGLALASLLVVVLVVVIATELVSETRRGGVPSSFEQPEASSRYPRLRRRVKATARGGAWCPAGTSARPNAKLRSSRFLIRSLGVRSQKSGLQTAATG